MNKYQRFIDAMLQDDIKTISELFQDKDISDGKNNALIVAASHGKTESIKFLLAAGAHTECCNEDTKQTPLIYAITSENRDAIKELLDANANINAVDYHGLTPFMHAAIVGDV